MDRIKELNQLNEGILQPYRKLSKSKTGIINNHLSYFLAVGLAYLVASFTSGVQTGGEESYLATNPLIDLVSLVLTIVVIIGLTSWTLSLYRAVIEKTANKDLTLTKSSFIPDFKENFFKRGLKYCASSFIYGLIIGFVCGILIGLTFPLLMGGVMVGSMDNMGNITGGLFGIFASLLLMFALFAGLAVLVSPFIYPMTTLYVYYGDDIGVFEAVKLSFKIGKDNYLKLLVTSLKVAGLNLLGLLAFGVGFIYTSVWGILIEVDVVSEILGVSLKDGSKFDGTYYGSKEPIVVVDKVEEPVVEEVTEVEVEEEPVEVVEEPLVESEWVSDTAEVDEVLIKEDGLDDTELSDEELVEESLADYDTDVEPTVIEPEDDKLK